MDKKPITRTFPKDAKYVADREVYDNIDGLVYLRKVGSPEDGKGLVSRKTNSPYDVGCPFNSNWRYEIFIGPWLIVGGVFAKYSEENKSWDIHERWLMADCDKQLESVYESGLTDENQVEKLMLERATELKEDMSLSAGIPYLEKILRKDGFHKPKPS